MQKFLTLFTYFIMLTNADAQALSDPLSGTYSAFYNGDNLSMVIQAPSDNVYTGTMRDSHQTYAVELTRSDSDINGTATESSLGLTFHLSGILKQEQDQLALHFELDVQGMKTGMDITFAKHGGAVSKSANTSSQVAATFPAGAEHPETLIGSWTKEELYQSGFGDNYMGAGFSQSVTFLPNGQLAEGGSTAYISGSHYSGQASDTNQNILPGVLWYTQGNQLYLLVTENGVTQTHHFGKFYIEGTNMLITATNGEKVLLQRN